jgi:hypothetical protein
MLLSGQGRKRAFSRKGRGIPCPADDEEGDHFLGYVYSGPRKKLKDERDE